MKQEKTPEERKCRPAAVCIFHMKPQSVVRLHPYFVLLSGRLFSAFVEDVAGYIEKKNGKQDDGNNAEDG